MQAAAWYQWVTPARWNDLRLDKVLLWYHPTLQPASGTARGVSQLHLPTNATEIRRNDKSRLPRAASDAVRAGSTLDCCQRRWRRRSLTELWVSALFTTDQDCENHLGDNEQLLATIPRPAPSCSIWINRSAIHPRDPSSRLRARGKGRFQMRPCRVGEGHGARAGALGQGLHETIWALSLPAFSWPRPCPASSLNCFCPSVGV